MYLFDVLNVPGHVSLLRPEEQVVTILKVLSLSSPNLGRTPGTFTRPECRYLVGIVVGHRSQEVVE